MTLKRLLLQDVDGLTPLSFAAHSGHMQVVDVLLRARASVENR